jgi:hypothetical protein
MPNCPLIFIFLYLAFVFDRVLVNAVFDNVGTRKDSLDGISRRRKLLMPPVSVATLKYIIQYNMYGDEMKV